MIGKKIMAQDAGRNGKRGNIGIIEAIDENAVKVFNKKNPSGYQYYELKRSDFDMWILDELYVLK